MMIRWSGEVQVNVSGMLGERDIGGRDSFICGQPLLLNVREYSCESLLSGLCRLYIGSD